MPRSRSGNLWSRTWSLSITLRSSTRRSTRDLGQLGRNRSAQMKDPANSCSRTWLWIKPLLSAVVSFIMARLLDFLIKITFYNWSDVPTRVTTEPEDWGCSECLDLAR